MWTICTSQSLLHCLAKCNCSLLLLTAQSLSSQEQKPNMTLFRSYLVGFPYEKVVQRVLYLQVLDYDRFSRNDPIGEVSIPLNKIDLTQMQTFWKELKPCSDGSVRYTFLTVFSVCYTVIITLGTL